MKILSILITGLILTGCASTAPKPLSWSSDLSSIKEEPINKNLELIQNELVEKKQVWGNE